MTIINKNKARIKNPKEKLITINKPYKLLRRYSRAFKDAWRSILQDDLFWELTNLNIHKYA